ncbi:DUF7683 domain-containing protein [Kiloniella sp.]|uniref:DUF7683 domain-containing protein n=1 Tax=Kiloniella sp. TaxID=1938587 RepID=UPI003B020E38
MPYTRVMKQYIYCFEKEGDDLIKIIELPKLELSIMQELFNIKPENPMYDSYPIGPKEIFFFKPMVDKDFDFSEFSCFYEQN